MNSSGPEEERAGATPQNLTRFATGSGPVNRRTVRQPLAQLPARTHPSLHQRLAQEQLRQRLGTPLSQRLTSRAAASGRPTPISHASVVTAAALTVCGLGLFLAVLQASWLLAGLAATGAVATGAGWWAWQRRVASRLAVDGSTDAEGLPLFDSAALTKLDEVLNHLASEMTEAQLLPLRQLADTLERIAPLMRRVGVSERFTREDHFYVIECVRRYLPDTLQAYLQVPRDRRAQPIPADQATGTLPSADQLLATQLALLQSELARREDALSGGSTEALQKQARFLKARRSPD